MSDLDQAVQAEIDSFTPAAPPAYDALVRRRSRRDRRRLVAGGTALSAGAVAVTAVLVLPFGSGPDRLPTGAVAPGASAAAPSSPLPPREPAGAELCRTDGTRTECYDVGRSQAGVLADALATGRPRQEPAECLAAPARTHRVTWLPVRGSRDPVVWTIPSVDCLPMDVAGTRYDLGRGARAVVARVFDSAGFVAIDATTTGRVPASAPRSAERAVVRPAPADGSYHEALATGVLRADRATGCLWLERADGTAGVPLLLQGESYRVDLDASPAVVLDGGSVVARVGDRVELGGGFDDREAGVEGCPVAGAVFLGYF